MCVPNTKHVIVWSGDYYFVQQHLCRDIKKVKANKRGNKLNHPHNIISNGSNKIFCFFFEEENGLEIQVSDPVGEELWPDSFICSWVLKSWSVLVCGQSVVELFFPFLYSYVNSTPLYTQKNKTRTIPLFTLCSPAPPLSLFGSVAFSLADLLIIIPH